ncbi:protein RNA-directed DNA methylation 3-like [Carica papaya]|uniref:protein RNA-directed DNA methylation 3-like n=1 Tax=Carica papaya TaxID=3649 RepID=UPI000B8D193B|nr:protein RNA-directed DNA methylation 3-like [Carica papaya]
MANKYDLYDLVCFGRKDFGLILGMEKDNCYKILKGSDGPDVVSVDMKEIKSGPIDTKFTAFDRNTKNVSVNDLVKVAEGPSEGQQGTVKQVYRGILFLYDENETENGGYFCCKSSMCEKIKLSFDACSEKNDEARSSGFGDFSSSPKSPLSPKKPWQARESNSNFNRGDNDSMFSVGQTLRIRVGPLKGYLCRVLAIRFSDVTVKLDSQHKVLTVKSEYLSEVRGRSSAMSLGDDTGSGSLKPFDLLGAEGSSGDWLDRAGASAGGDNRWNGGRPSAERSSWPSFNTSGISLQTQPNPANLFGSEESNLKDSNQNSTWGAAAAGKKPIGNGQVSGWNSWAKATVEDGSGNGGSDGWGATGDSLGSSKEAWNSCHNKETSEKWSNNDCAGGNTSNWNSSMPVAENPTGDCGNACRSWAQQEAETDQAGGWKKAKIGSGSETAEVGCTKNFGDDAAGWKKSGSSNEDQTESWSKPMASGNNGGTSWEKQDRGPSWGKQDGGSGWGKEGGSSWSKQETGFCGEQDGSSSWSNREILMVNKRVAHLGATRWGCLMEQTRGKPYQKTWRCLPEKRWRFFFEQARWRLFMEQKRWEHARLGFLVGQTR